MTSLLLSVVISRATNPGLLTLITFEFLYRIVKHILSFGRCAMCLPDLKKLFCVTHNEADLMVQMEGKYRQVSPALCSPCHSEGDCPVM
mmetsp:Transcript_29189/g.93812  ORF Transcript_29189/g.93812 Transcript_29189/m.93812 type:complete len:89 (+) Transcript_29189:160-426(+)